MPAHPLSELGVGKLPQLGEYQGLMVALERLVTVTQAAPVDRVRYDVADQVVWEWFAADLATLARNTCIQPGPGTDYPIQMLAQPTAVQQRAFDLLGVTPRL